MKKDLSNKVVLGTLLPVLAIMGLLIANRTAVLDWWHFLRYEPTSNIRLLADEADFNEAGRHLFYRADPTLISSGRVENLCLGADNLGCLVTGPRIYILEYEPGETEVFNQAVVTGAHEMLHMAYFRLSDEERQNVQRLIDQALMKVSDSRIFSILNSTQTTEEYYDEAHAILGTEVERVPLELEAHYRQYFNDRANVLEAFDKSERLLQ